MFQHASRSAVETFAVLAFAKLADILTSAPQLFNSLTSLNCAQNVKKADEGHSKVA
jgi:hypothetical protein